MNKYIPKITANTEAIGTRLEYSPEPILLTSKRRFPPTRKTNPMIAIVL